MSGARYRMRLGRTLSLIPIGLVGVVSGTAALFGGDRDRSVVIMIVAVGAALVCAAPVLFVSVGSSSSAPIPKDTARARIVWRIASSRWWFGFGAAVGAFGAMAQFVFGMPSFGIACIAIGIAFVIGDRMRLLSSGG